MIGMDRITSRAVARLVLVSALVALPERMAHAQQAVDLRWQAWLGCWQPSEAQAGDGSGLQRICVVPARERAGVALITFTSGRETSRELLDATGQQMPMARDGCVGWQVGRFSSDDRRVYIRSELTCPGDLKRASTGVLAMTPGGEFLGVESVAAGGGIAVRVSRYREADFPDSLPGAIAQAISGSRTAIGAARIAAGAPIGLSGVIETSRQVDAPVLQVMLAERGQRFELDASGLTTLARAGVPGGVTDVMVALDHPALFMLDDEGGVDSRSVSDSVARRKWSPFGGSRPDYYGRSSCSSFSRGAETGAFWYLSPFGYGYSPYSVGSPCGAYRRYGYGSFGSGWYRGRIVVLARPTGQAVKGQGYNARGQSSGTRTATGRRTGTSSTGAARTSGSSGRSSGSGRTAKPRP